MTGRLSYRQAGLILYVSESEVARSAYKLRGLITLTYHCGLFLMTSIWLLSMPSPAGPMPSRFVMIANLGAAETPGISVLHLSSTDTAFRPRKQSRFPVFVRKHWSIIPRCAVYLLRQSKTCSIICRFSHNRTFPTLLLLPRVDAC